MHLIQTHAFQIAPASGPSMLPTFTVAGEYVLTDATHARNRRSQLRPGDLVTYRIPIFRRDLGMKRLVGLEGDYVSIGTVGEKGEDMMIQLGPPRALLDNRREPPRIKRFAHVWALTYSADTGQSDCEGTALV
ncbi:hypothetical protein N3K66_007104 [Trichothecium roseum]|uniref:Uncharacterized protein n=1 Tax=Trichothecium roseum TaxID=47278 RepID=A0ACC0UXB6_9HYPO|nr:hypothetical protein N3K66_007104 [Trichothecium roseum]